ncbi:anti-sigma factor family protein [Cytophaga aurantiaca]|uniref:anti-sigma factor family protein n=1 Tax=Cytophaga aurantiaca TaxID=29530 RepID=UPI000368BAFA|nr:hypothetical protein [Cytophaga aurantiaca]
MEKFTTEWIEQYLEGKLSVSERLEMEEAMAQNPELKEEVMLQQALVNKIEDQALRALAKDAHLRYMKGNSGSGISSNGKWIFGITVFVITLATLLFFVSKTNTGVEASKETKSDTTEFADTDTTQIPAVTGVIEKTNSDFPEVPFMVYTFFAEKGAEIKDPRSGTVIKVSANSLVHADGSIVKGKVVLKYREFRNQADIALSGIPMTYKEYNFNSAGMFEIYALQDGDTLGIKNQSAVAIDFVMTKNEAGIGFYQLDQQKQEWEFIEALNNRQEVVDGFNAVSRIREAWPQKTPTFQGDLKDAFVRSLGYQEAVIEGKTSIPEVPEKPKGDFNKLFEDETYKQIAGSDTSSSSNRIVVEEIKKEFKKKESGFAAFFKRIRLSGGSIVIPLNENPKVDTSLSIVVKDRRYTIIENGKNIVMTELQSLKGSQFIYNGNADFDALAKKTVYDLRLTRDTTVLNRFVLELKTDEGLLNYQLRLESPDFTSFEEYDKQQRLRMLTYDNRIKLKEKEYQNLVQLRNERKDLMDSVSFYGNESIFRMARLIMTEDELKMTQEEWFASLDTNKTLKARIDATLDSIEAYGDDANVYMNKLANERKKNLANKDLFEQTYVDSTYYHLNLLMNLKIKDFGIYNCDQVYRIQAPIRIKAKYVKEDNTDLLDIVEMSLIDPKVNAAFNLYTPTSFTCSASGDNMVLVFTKNKIYFFDKEKWKAEQIKKGGVWYIFKMTDITAQVKTSKDLQKILEADPL